MPIVVIILLIVFAPNIIGFVWPILLAVGVWIALYIFKEIVGGIFGYWFGPVLGFIVAFVFLAAIGL